MERIVLEVDNALAKAWRDTTPQLRSTYQNKISELLRELKEKEFDKLLSKAGKIAAGNGLNEEKLQQLLDDED